MPTIQDVARLAGVSPITVSRVLNHSGYASEETRSRVEAAVAELGYVPNTLARGLRSKRTNTLALVMTDITNPFFTLIARGVEDTASNAGYTVIFCNTDESEAEEEKYLNILVQKQVDGVLLVPACSNPKSLNFLRSNEIPFVLLDRSVPGTRADLIRCDSEQGAYNLTRHLIDLGHKRIVTITGPREVSTAQDRASGYQRAMNEAGLADSVRVYYGFLRRIVDISLPTRPWHFNRAQQPFWERITSFRLAFSKPSRMRASASRRTCQWSRLTTCRRH